MIAVNSVLAASFDCKKAGTVVEKAICNNVQVSELDGKLGEIYLQLKKSLPKNEFNQLKIEQRDWLKKRNICGSDTLCLFRLYEQRIAELSSKSIQNSSEQNNGCFSDNIDCLLSNDEKFAELKQYSNFSCARPDTVVEKMICANHSLSQMDNMLRELYSQRLKSSSETESEQLMQKQQEWLIQRNNCVVIGVDCLLSSYEQRITEFTKEDQNFYAAFIISNESIESEKIRIVREILNTLQKLSLITKGMEADFKEYGKLVIDVKVQFDESLPKLLLIEKELKNELEITLNAYVDALKIWNIILNNERLYVNLEPILFSKYSIPVTNNHNTVLAETSKEAALSAIWHFANEHFKYTDELFKQYLQKQNTQSPNLYGGTTILESKESCVKGEFCKDNEVNKISPSYSSSSTSSGSSGSVNVRGYYRKDGTYVRPHTRKSRSK